MGAGRRGLAVTQPFAVRPAAPVRRRSPSGALICVAVLALAALAPGCGGGGPESGAPTTWSSTATSASVLPSSVATWPAPSAGMLALRAKYPAPGELVRLPDGRLLHLTSIGAGAPTVVMEAGSGDWSLTWCLVAPAVAEGSPVTAGTRVVTYDRAGLGWSGPTGLPPTAAGFVQDLHDGLAAAGVRPPYVLVGHSMGGVYVRLFAHTYPDEVVGMVLVDPGDERIPEAVGAKSAAAITAGTATVTKLNGQKADEVAAGDSVSDQAQIPADPRWPPKTAAQYRALFAADPWVYQAIALEGASAAGIWDEVAAEHITSLGNIPLVVVRSSTSMGLSGVPALAARENRVWRRLQADQATQSSRGRLVVAPISDHYVQLADPSLVITLVERVVAEARALVK